MKASGIVVFCVSGVLVALATAVCAAPEKFERPIRTLELPVRPSNPRNSEGALAKLRDGRVILAYSRYYGTNGNDHGSAVIALRESRDGGFTWTKEDRTIVENEGGMNVMSVSLLRMADGRLALFYLVKNSFEDCRPVMRVSTDEGATWGAPVKCVADADVGYYVLNNDRAVQLKSGRIVLPLCHHDWLPERKTWDMNGEVLAALSDAGGATWRLSRERRKGYDPLGRRISTQEPGVIELRDGTVLMWIRGNGGVQYAAYSHDGGESWSRPSPWALHSPVSPATVFRLRNGDLCAVWNDHEGHPELKRKPGAVEGLRTPLAIAISTDEGRSWSHRKILESNPKGWYCYIAQLEMDGYVLLSYCAERGLGHSRVTAVPLAWVYGPDPDPSDPFTFKGAAFDDLVGGDIDGK